jgi:Flp pilus assembly pilin Flp
VTAGPGFTYEKDHAKQIHPLASACTATTPSVHRIDMKGGESAMTFRDWFTYFRAYAQREDGQTMAEYAVVLTVIAAVVIAALTLLTLAISGRLGEVTDVINGGG